MDLKRQDRRLGKSATEQNNSWISQISIFQTCKCSRKRQSLLSRAQTKRKKNKTKPTKQKNLRAKRTQGLFLDSYRKPPNNSFLEEWFPIPLFIHLMLYKNIWKPSIIALFPSAWDSRTKCKYNILLIYLAYMYYILTTKTSVFSESELKPTHFPERGLLRKKSQVNSRLVKTGKYLLLISDKTQVVFCSARK